MLHARHAQSRWLLILTLLWLGIFTVTRTALLLQGDAGITADPLALLNIYGVGLLYDLGFLSFAVLPLAFLMLWVPARLWQAGNMRYVLQATLVLSLFLMLYVASAEWLFWDEFGNRFNFIAVDYLVYSQEVIANILESYPVFTILGGLFTLSVIASFMLNKALRWTLSAPVMRFRQRGVYFSLLLAVAVLGGMVLTQDFPRSTDGNTYVRELSSNGPYQFFAAFRGNELNYNENYAKLSPEKIAEVLRNEVIAPNARFTGTEPLDIRREITYPGQPRKLNVVLVTIESLSAKYLGSQGDKRNLTPVLDQLRKESLYFNNFYATGTRTDRGLEAITLSIPPTPGRSIVKRVGHESGFSSLGQQFAARGYDTAFIYGGRGYFDNMNAFFAGNGYRIVDQTSVPDNEMSFTNAWGMADEDLYQQTLKIADADFAVGKPFYLQLMTTSNHRPYTYPDGRIDIRSGKGRDGAVKYTDYAIGQFLQHARERKWFADTVFIFVADHCAGSAGGEDLPVANYHIPMWIYAPQLLSPREISTLTSQIDVAPTLMGLLNMSYVSTFFGRDVLSYPDIPGRVVLGNYQHLGLFDGQDLSILSPRSGMRRHDDARGESTESHTTAEDALTARNIAYYQGASYIYAQRLNAWLADESARFLAQLNTTPTGN